MQGEQTGLLANLAEKKLMLHLQKASIAYKIVVIGGAQSAEHAYLPLTAIHVKIMLKEITTVINAGDFKATALTVLVCVI